MRVRGTTIDILLVEDNPGDAKQFTTFVNGDFQVTVAESGAEALDRVFRRGRFRYEPVPDLIVLDLNLPILNGHDVLNVIRGNSKTFHLPVVVWSGSSREEDIAKAYELGCCAYMLKANELQETESLLGAFSEFWLHQIRYPVYNETPSS
jgi:CheY-like chemotaxis protein